MILKHRDRELLRFEWVEPQGVRVLSVNESERKFLPLEMKGVADDESLWSWLRHRTVPKHRNYIQQMLGNIGIVRMDTRSIIEICKGLSLYDTWLGFPGGVTSEMTARLSALNGFRIKRHPKYNLSSRRIAAIEDFIQKRIREIFEFGAKADELLGIPSKSCTVINTIRNDKCTVKSESLGVQIKQSMTADPFITKVELADMLQVSPRWIARKIKELQEAGEIRRVGADKNGHWEVG